MAVLGSTMSLHGAPGGETDEVHSSQKRSAILLHLNKEVMRDLQQCCQHGKVMQLLGGNSPRIRYGSKTLDLNVKPETFRHEIYSAGTESSDQGAFAALVSHEAHVKTAEPRAESETAGADAALATLKQSLASMAKEKEARKATINLQPGKNAKLHAHRQPASLPNRATATSTPRLDVPPTSAPHLDSRAKATEKGMRTALIHFLAVEPVSEQDIISQTRIPRLQLTQLLPKIADKLGAKWELSSKSFRDIDPWGFRYQSEAQRQAVVDNAIRAFDRARIAKDDQLWQILLPKEERGKGKVLSRLHLGVERRDQLGTPGPAATPAHETSEKAATPKVGPVSTPRNGALATGRSAAGISIEKRLKDAKKKQDLEKKKRDKEAVASDRETKPRETKARPIASTKKVTAKKSEKIKSDEIVHDSDDEEGEITDSKPAKKSDSSVGISKKMIPKTSTELDQRMPDQKQPKLASTKAKASAARVSDLLLEDNSGVRQTKREKFSEGITVAARKPVTATGHVERSRPKASATAKQTLSQKPTKNAAAATSSSQRQISPKKDTKPKVPSPLGTSKPRNASEEAERIKNTAPSRSSKPAQATTKSGPQSNVVPRAPKPSLHTEPVGRPAPVIRKRPLEASEDGKEPPRKANKVTANSTVKNPASAAVKSTASSSASARVDTEGNIKRRTIASSSPEKTSSSPKNVDGNLERKANDISSRVHDHEVPSSKHRKTHSSSTHSIDQTNSSLTSLTTAPTASPDPSSPSSVTHNHADPLANSTDVIQMFLNDSEASPKTQSSWEAALDKAARFRTQLYPAYIELYDKLESMAPDEVREEDKRTLFMMHGKLKAFKKDIYDAVG